MRPRGCPKLARKPAYDKKVIELDGNEFFNSVWSRDRLDCNRTAAVPLKLIIFTKTTLGSFYFLLVPAPRSHQNYPRAGPILSSPNEHFAISLMCDFLRTSLPKWAMIKQCTPLFHSPTMIFPSTLRERKRCDMGVSNVALHKRQNHSRQTDRKKL